MAEHNPYAPSKASLVAGKAPSTVSSEDRVWCDGNTVVMVHGASLPHRCVKCNEPAIEPTKMRAIWWVHPAVYILLLGGWLILLIVYFALRKRADVDPGLCERHKKRRLLGLTIGWVGSLLGFLLIIMGIGGDSPGPALFGVLFLLAAIIFGLSMGRLLYAKKVTKDEVRLGGFGKAFLDDLPTYPGAKRRR